MDSKLDGIPLSLIEKYRSCDGIIYRVKEDRCEIAPSAPSYGVLAIDPDTGTVLAQISDICTDKALLEREVRKWNTHRLALCHLHDVVEDLLTE